MVLFSGVVVVFKTALTTFAFLVFLYALGFLVFWQTLPEEKEEMATAQPNQGLVVFTGGSKRIDYAFEHLKNGYDNPLLITGVSTLVSKEALLSKIPERYHHLVTIDYTAKTTRENVVATQRWMESHHIHNIILITSHYHMPRSLASLSQAGFGKVKSEGGFGHDVFVYPVIPESLPFVFLLREYTKYILAMFSII